MRKTVLWKSKEPTPEFGYPTVARDGRSVSMKHKPKSNLARSKRFVQYEIDANRVGRNVGPGAYSHVHNSISSRISENFKNTMVFYKHEDSLNNSHYFRDYSSAIPNFLSSRFIKK